MIEKTGEDDPERPPPTSTRDAPPPLTSPPSDVQAQRGRLSTVSQKKEGGGKLCQYRHRWPKWPLRQGRGHTRLERDHVRSDWTRVCHAENPQTCLREPTRAFMRRIPHCRGVHRPRRTEARRVTTSQVGREAQESKASEGERQCEFHTNPFNRPDTHALIDKDGILAPAPSGRVGRYFSQGWLGGREQPGALCKM